MQLQVLARRRIRPRPTSPNLAQSRPTSPNLAHQALGATRRRVSKPAKPPKGLRWGLALTGAMRTKWGGGGGNLQTFAGQQHATRWGGHVHDTCL